MSVAGIKKQFYKASQMVSEKVGGAEGTKLDEDFRDLERKADVTSKAVVEVINKTSEYLQPNPATRAKLSMLNTVSKIRGQVKSPGYPQPEGLLGECMTKYGRDMGEDTNFGGALIDIGDTMKRMSEVKDSLDIDVKQNFIDPLQAVAERDIKDIQHHLKKLEGRRLDYDYKKKRQGKIPDEEIRQALEKFHESKEMAEASMHNLLETDVEQVSQLNSLVESLLQYHRQAAQLLTGLSEKLSERMMEAQSRPRREYTPKPRPVFDYGDAENSNGGYSPAASSPPAYSPARVQYQGPSFQRTSIKSRPPEPCCKALYDFEPENEGELGFHEGDIIALVSRIDENWFEGSIRGKSGYFPNNYVEVVVPLPH
ncbi:endophilin-A2-like isoform X1 [Epinephelus fuscoguttatus]|uniref:endophilin-A2-like isoform X1 n=1 Tax=Epinephelus lanceolatus TaxID=310571 RepID=UPI0014469D45|nr:endophilin-A2-like isoform X1 [Epinephelus lanceolatus]XP_049454010.1 endophilin-A2-like isoform X1 [Epinephelus fuscoguttatus]